MNRYTYCDTTDRVFFKVDELSQKELVISEDACDRLNDLEAQLKLSKTTEQATEQATEQDEARDEKKERCKKETELSKIAILHQVRGS